MVKKKRSGGSHGHIQRTARKRWDGHRVAEDVTKDVIRFLKAAVVSAILPDMKRLSKDAVHTGQEIIYHTEDIMLTRIYSFALLTGGALVVLIAVVYLAELYFTFHRAWTLLVLGMLMLAGSRLIHTKMRRREYYVFK